MPSSALRKHVLANARSIVVKMGSQLTTAEAGGPNRRFMRHIADQVAALIARGIRVTLVSSGAVGVGFRTLGMDRKPTGVATAQAVAALGQSGLMSAWHQAFGRHGIETAQILLTREDVESRSRYLNIRNCINEAHKLGCMPVINENDSVSVDEIRLGDNDVLAAMLANALCCDALILLTGVDGLLDREGQILEIVHDALDARALVTDDTSTLGTGGMATKLEAARRVTDSGEIAVIANGNTRQILTRLIDGEKLGTVFMPAQKRLSGRDRWIATAVRPTGVLVIDDGAVRALTERGKSLLATGIAEITGAFEKGDVVVVRDSQGHEVARGLINYSAKETRLIMGKRSDQFPKLLGRQAYQAVVHRDNMVLAKR